VPSAAANRCHRRARRDWSARPPSAPACSCRFRSDSAPSLFTLGSAVGPRCFAPCGSPAGSVGPTALGLSRRALHLLLVLVILHQVGDADRPVADFRNFEDVVDHLVLENGGAQIVERPRLVAIVFNDLALLAGIAPRLLHEGAIEFLLGHLNIVAAPHLGKEQSQPHPPLGDGAVLRLDLIVALALVRLGDALLLGALALRLELLPDDIELEIDHALRYGEMVTLGQAVKEPSLQPLMRRLLDRLAERHHFPVPQGMVDLELDVIWKQFEAERERAKQQGVAQPDEGKSDDEIKAEYRAIAERRMRLGLLLSEVGRSNNIQVAQEELNRALMEEARRYPGQERQVIEYYRNQPGALDNLRAPIFENKVIDYILEIAEVSDRPISIADLMQDDEDEEKVEGAAAEA